MAYIKAISYYLPQSVVTNEELVKQFPEWTVDKIAGKVGVSERHLSAEDETAGDMAVKAAEKLFEENGIERNTIDFVLLCTQSSDYFLPSTACLIQDKLGIPTTSGAFDFNLGCSGYEYGLAVAKGLIAGGIASNILLLTAETYNKYLHPRDKGNKTIFGDGASATLVSTEGFADIGEFVLGTDGRGAEGLIVKTGASRSKQPVNDVVFDESGNPRSSDYLYMDGKAIFDFTVQAVPPMINDVISKNGLAKDDVDLFVFHQANKYMINFLRKLTAIDKEKFFVYLDKLGNTVSSTIPIALCMALADGSLKDNFNVLSVAQGLGYTWGGFVLKVKF